MTGVQTCALPIWIGRGRIGMTRDEEEEELELVEMTEAFLERSASVGVAVAECSGEG